MDEPTSPDPDQPAPPPASGWDVPETASPEAAPARPPSRVTLVLSWIAGLIIAGFGGWVATRGVEGSDAYRAGSAAGAVVTPFLIAGVLRLVVVRVRSGRAGMAALRSPWVPLGGALLAGVLAAGRLGSMVPSPPVDASTAMHVTAPFTLQDADPTTVQQIERGLREDARIGSIAIREVVGDDGATSVLIAADARLADDGIREVAAGMQDSSGLVPTIESIAGEEVAVVTQPEGVIATWIDSPLLMTLIAPDDTTMRAVIESVIGSG